MPDSETELLCDQIFRSGESGDPVEPLIVDPSNKYFINGNDLTKAFPAFPHTQFQTIPNFYDGNNVQIISGTPHIEGNDWEEIDDVSQYFKSTTSGINYNFVKAGSHPYFKELIDKQGCDSYFLWVDGSGSNKTLRLSKQKKSTAAEYLIDSWKASNFRDNIFPSKLFILLQGAGGGAGYATDPSLPGGGGGSGAAAFSFLDIGKLNANTYYKIIVGKGGKGGYRTGSTPYETYNPAKDGGDTYIIFINNVSQQILLNANGGKKGDRTSGGAGGDAWKYTYPPLTDIYTYNVPIQNLDFAKSYYIKGSSGGNSWTAGHDSLSSVLINTLDRDIPITQEVDYPTIYTLSVYSGGTAATGFAGTGGGGGASNFANGGNGGNTITQNTSGTLGSGGGGSTVTAGRDGGDGFFQLFY